jgi:hypothetical protein
MQTHYCLLFDWENEMTKYQVFDKQTMKLMGTYKTRMGAVRAMDRLDNAYGAYRYFVRAIIG